MQRSGILTLILIAALGPFAGTAHRCAAAESADQRTLTLYDFERSSRGWQPVRGTADKTPSLALSSAHVHSGKASLKLGMHLPEAGEAAVELPPNKRNWHPYTHLRLSVYTPESAPGRIQLIVFLKDTDLYYYQHLRKNYLRAGNWTHVTIDLTADSRMWEFKGHYKPWDGYCRQDVQELGIKFVSPRPYEGPLFLDKLELLRRPKARSEENAIYNLRSNREAVKKYEKFELSFNLARTYSNPFDPDVVRVSGHFIKPDGTEVRVPGFFYQGYLRRMEKGAEKLVPMGRSQWKIRFAPGQTGTYQYFVMAEGSEETVRSDMGQFTCTGKGGAGYVRISKKHPDYFEFDDGSFYYPIGHNVAAVHDSRARTLQVNIPASEGTFAYDRILSRMSRAGENWTRIWMSPWSFEIEWTKAYDTHYRGLGRYNLENAWRLDHILRVAEASDLYAMLLFTAHGEIGDYESDFWGHDPKKLQGSPYWSRYGGPLSHPREWYTSEKALEIYKKKVRYIVARWGYSRAIMAWEILNEPDLASFYKKEGSPYPERAARFVRKVAEHIRETDFADHLITSGTFRYRQSYSWPVLELDVLDFNTGHVFQGNLEHRLLSDLRFMQGKFDKIFLPTEAGLTPFAQDPETTALAIHRTLWSSCMIPAAGAAAPWWWVLIDRRDLYFQFEALAAFVEGEDRRGAGYNAASGSVQDTSGERSLRISVLKNDRRAFCWIYQPTAFSSRSAWQSAPKAPAKVTIPNLKVGSYSIEIWDTYEGKVIKKLEADSRPTGTSSGESTGGKGEGILRFTTAPFARDVALKVRRLDRN